MSLSQLQSRIPTPVSDYGYSLSVPIKKRFIYDGRQIPAFLLANGGDPTKVREFLTLNKIGSAFTLQPGMLVEIP